VRVKPANKVVKTEPAESKRCQSATGNMSLGSGVGSDFVRESKACQHKIQKMSSLIDECLLISPAHT